MAVANARVLRKAKSDRVAVPRAGLVIAGIAVAPLLAFAVLWTSLLLILGGAWVLHALHLF